MYNVPVVWYQQWKRSTSINHILRLKKIIEPGNHLFEKLFSTNRCRILQRTTSIKKIWKRTVFDEVNFSRLFSEPGKHSIVVGLPCFYRERGLQNNWKTIKAIMIVGYPWKDYGPIKSNQL